MLGNLETEKKSQNRVRTLANNQPPLQKLNFGNGTLKITQKQISKFSGLNQFYYCVTDCSSSLKSFKRGNSIKKFLS